MFAHSSSSTSSLPLAPPPELTLFDSDSDEDLLAIEAPTIVPSTSNKSYTTPAAASSSSTGRRGATSPGHQSIEMEPVTGHRRRKSSLMNPVGGHHANNPPQYLGGVPPRSITPGKGSPNHASGSSAEQPHGILEAEGDVAISSSSDREDASRDSFSDEDLNEDEETGLTSGERAEKRKKKQRNMRLDQRIVREQDLSPEDEKPEEQSITRQMLINGTLILLWYFFSLSISLYNKWMFDKEQLNFTFPLFTTSMHMAVQFTLASLVLYLVPSLRPGAAKRTSDLGRSRHEDGRSSGMTKMFYLTRVGPCGIATSLDIGFGNMSLQFISLTFYTMCKSSSLAFVLLFAFIFRLETPTWRLVAIIATMTAGVILMVFGEVEFQLGGFVLVISAAFFSGFRWSLTQLLLLRNPATSNPFSSIFFLSPIMFLTLFTMAISVEGFGPLFEGFARLTTKFGVVLAPLVLLFPGCIAFLMIASEFALLKRTSVVTLSIAGIFKEVITISAASFVFDDKLTMINFVGLLVTLAAIIAYNYLKISKMRAEAAGYVGVAEGDTTLSSRPGHSHSQNTGHEEHDDSNSTEESHGLLYQAPEAGPSHAANNAGH